jgi:hypothetical protein
MGILDRIKKAVDTGGIGVSFATAKTFRWSDDVLPVDIVITSSADEPRTVSSVRLQLSEYDQENPASTRQVRGRYEGTNLFLREPFTLEPDQEHPLHVDFPLSLKGAAEELGADGTPGWLDTVSGVMNTLTELNRDQEWYLLRVIPEVEGFTAQKIGSRRIRNLRTGEWGGGFVRTTIGGD